MMAIRRALAMVVALVVSATFAVAQQAPTKKDDRKRSKQEQQEIEQVVKIVDGVMAGQPAPTDITMSLEPFFMKSQEARTFVPFVLTVNNAPAAPAALYIRVVNPAAQPDPKAKKIEYPGTTFISFRRESRADDCTACSWRRPGPTTSTSPTKSARREERTARLRAEDGRAEDAGHRARLLQRRAEHEHGPRRREGQHVDRADLDGRGA